MTVSHFNILVITTSEGNPGHYIVYTDEGNEKEYSKKYLSSKIGIKRFKKLLRE